MNASDLLSMFFQDWGGLIRTVLVGILACAALIALLRFSGKRTLSKMNAFDLVVTVALGSTLATILLSEDVALAEGIVAFSVLIGMQFGIAWLSVRSKRVGRLVKSGPRILVLRGRLLRVETVILETDGSFAVIHRTDGGDLRALRDLSGYHRDEHGANG
ncbi:DUF421 domain-containing protein [Microbacterium sp. CFH 31415]|uniref:DUF421 domain-containing protein n=1 Tax=Microbacterium sp. CFH 31415 TaxID=2921732 RepID=UPI001F13BD27|nr:DUF421 domain-containing protein [Microbacterium sp. CFH 31415]MCH6230433.1 DUF421 domain-containing protein [Microbacterium sp. CFH 31415]